MIRAITRLFAGVDRPRLGELDYKAFPHSDDDYYFRRAAADAARE